MTVMTTLGHWDSESFSYSVVVRYSKFREKCSLIQQILDPFERYSYVCICATGQSLVHRSLTSCGVPFCVI